MKKEKIIYWTSTGVIALVMALSALYFTFSAEAAKAFEHLGYPHYFAIEITIAKLLGVVVLLVPYVPSKIKEFAYFGFAIVIVSAAIAHYSSGDGWQTLDPLVFLVVLAVSYVYYHKIRYRESGLRHIL
jgi:hypothetical protein